MNFPHRCRKIMQRLELGGWWPDVACAAAALVGMTILLVFDAQAAKGTGIGELLPEGLSTVWVALIATTAAVYAAGVLVRRWGIAWWGSMALAALFAANASVTVKVNGLGSVPAAVCYTIAVILLCERARVFDTRAAEVQLPVPWECNR